MVTLPVKDLRVELCGLDTTAPNENTIAQAFTALASNSQYLYAYNLIIATHAIWRHADGFAKALSRIRKDTPRVSG